MPCTWIPRAVLVTALVVSSNLAWSTTEVVDLGQRVPDVAQIREGLFPEEVCEELRRNGFKCMGFKPAVRFSIPNAHFELGSAQLPQQLKQQLDVFAEVLSNRPVNSPSIVVTGHADASGTPELNQSLSTERASAVKSYLINKGVAPQMLKVRGAGDKQLADSSNPFSASNRRVEISRLP